jgi:hypothetical protein
MSLAKQINVSATQLAGNIGGATNAGGELS